MKDVSRLYIRQNTTIESVMKRIDLGAHGIALLVDDEDRFVTTVTDGDVRRALLAGATVDSPITSAIKESSGEQRRSITAEAGTSEDEQRRLMRERSIRHLPLLDSRA